MDYKDLNVLKEEAEEGRRLGFDGKVRMRTPMVVDTVAIAVTD